MKCVHDHQLLLDESDEGLRRFFASPRFVHYVGELSRSVIECFAALEMTYFSPMTARNHLFMMRIMEWEGMLWGIVSIPAEDRRSMTNTALVNHLSIAEGAPVRVTDAGIRLFPVSNKRVFTLEKEYEHLIRGCSLRE